jgi:hypothetical protein
MPPCLQVPGSHYWILRTSAELGQDGWSCHDVSQIQSEGKKVSLLGKLKEARAELEAPADPWLAPLQRVSGKVEFDGLERVSSQTLLDMLEVPQRSRTAGTYRRLARLMAELGWTAVRVRDLTRGGYKEQVRGYVREGRR